MKTHILLIVSAIHLVSCAVVFEEEKDKKSSHVYIYEECQDESWSQSGMCGVKQDNDDYRLRWKMNCPWPSCQRIPVYVNYLLGQDLGRQVTIHVEAFDNYRFEGAPVALLHLTGFNASQPNSIGPEDIFLDVGSYYFRAYITNGERTPVPYPMNGLELVGGVPVGVHGALSQPERVVVSPGQQPSVHLNIDQLYGEPAKDYTKLLVSVLIDDPSQIPDYRYVHVKVLHRPEKTSEAHLDIQMPTADFLVRGRMGQAETDIVQIEPGRYYIFGFIDRNGNGHVDSNEPHGFYGEWQQPESIYLKEGQINSVELAISTFGT